MKYFGQPDFQHGEVPAVGVLLANLGTPDAPDTPSLRRYLREFLLDPRVIELPRLTWWLILHLFILTRRPKMSAELYRKVWTPEGSPLLAIALRQAAALQETLRREIGTPVHVAVGMRYGNPSIKGALRELAAGDPVHQPLPRRSGLHPGPGGEHPRCLGRRRAGREAPVLLPRHPAALLPGRRPLLLPVPEARSPGRR
jgi:hypothetical protein